MLIVWMDDAKAGEGIKREGVCAVDEGIAEDLGGNDKERDKPRKQ